MTGWDLAAFLIYLVGILGFSYALNRRRHTPDIFLAGRKMGWFPIGLSVMITLFSAVNFVAFPAEVIEHGLHVLASLPVFLLVALPITRIFIPFFHEMRLTSVYAYLEHRFDRRTRLLAATLFMLWRLFWMAAALYASARILGMVTNIPYPILILLAGGAAALYTALGGIRTVMWTDVIQFVVLVGGILAALWMAVSVQPEGWPGLWRTASEGGNLRPFHPFDPGFLSWDPAVRITLWSGLIGTFVAFLTRYGADQMVVQRYFTARSLQSAVRGFWWNILAALTALSLLALLGIAIAVAHGDTQVPAMVRFGAFARSLPHGLTGLLAAGLLAATMSSVDSGLNACLAVWMTDFRGKSPAPMSELAKEKQYRLLMGVFTILTITLAFIVGQAGDLFSVVNRVINGVGSPLLALMLLAMFCPSCNVRGAWIGGIFGMAFSLAFSFGVTGLSLHYYAVVNLCVTLAACLAVSAATARKDPVTPAQRAWLWSRPSRPAADAESKQGYEMGMPKTPL
ncbi:MAG: sodium/solute symporter [Verrucomicrobia bacterium]|nr:sodium/solute symporter [Verrucomicrobiota bacterium]MCH8513006.1 sodium/solute symporter [Kiritimatiellia bacterium]